MWWPEANLWGCGRRWAGFGILLSQWPEDSDAGAYKYDRKHLFNWKRLSDAHQVGVITWDGETTGAGSRPGNFAALLLHVDPAQKSEHARLTNVEASQWLKSINPLRHAHLSRCPASGELGLDGTSDFTSKVCWQESKLLCSLRRLRQAEA